MCINRGYNISSKRCGACFFYFSMSLAEASYAKNSFDAETGKLRSVRSRPHCISRIFLAGKAVTRAKTFENYVTLFHCKVSLSWQERTM